MTQNLMSALDLPSGYPELILRWATSQSNAFSSNEYGGDYWHTWISPAGLHSYDVNIYTQYDTDDTARVVVYELTTDMNGDIVTDTSNYCFIGNVDISHITAISEVTTLSVVEQLQDNLRCYLDGMSDEILDEVCQIVIDTLR